MMLPRGDALRPVAFAPDAETAERWARVLEDAGIEAHIRIEDGAPFRPLGSVYGQMMGGQAFVYPVLVSRLRHRAARRALAGEVAAATSAPALTPRAIATAVTVLGASMLMVAYLAWARGDL